MSLSVADTQRLRKEDVVVGGFTVVRDKLRYTKPQVKEVLPHWITSPVTCSSDLTKSIRVKKFALLDDFLIRNLRSMGIKRLFPGNPPFNPRDICISAPTGSGKTLAYALPIVQVCACQAIVTSKLLNSCSVHVIRAVVILPVRDLAKQAEETFKRLVAKTNLRVVLLAGEGSFVSEQQEIHLNAEGQISPPDIVVCTPGRLVDHVYNTPGFCLEHVRFLIIDEADRVISEEKQDWYNVFEGALYGVMHLNSSKNLALRDQVRSYPLPTIDSQCSTSRCTLQKILLSATLTHDPGPLKRFRLNFPRLFLATSLSEDDSSHTISVVPSGDEPSNMAIEEAGGETKDALCFDAHPVPGCRNKRPPIADGGASTGGVGVFSIPSGLKEFVVEITDKHKPPFLAYLVRKVGHERVLCFTNSRESTKRLALLMSHFNGLQARALYAGLPLAKRSRILKEFESGGVQLLICTDAVSRGIDIENVSCVVSYELPTSTKTYVHRIGRTARAGKTGVSYTLLLHNQIRHFKMGLRAVGMGKVKHFPFHASKLRTFEQDYQKALSELQKSFQKGFNAHSSSVVDAQAVTISQNNSSSAQDNSAAVGINGKRMRSEQNAKVDYSS
ncbi:hypothetical protein AAHC03_01016 [Spirometra sp. Aus1]